MCLTDFFLLVLYALNFHAGHCRLKTFLFSMKESLARFSRILLSKRIVSGLAVLIQEETFSPGL